MKDEISEYDKFLVGILNCRQNFIPMAGSDSAKQSSGHHGDSPKRSGILKKQPKRILVLFALGFLLVFFFSTGVLWFVEDNSWSSPHHNGSLKEAALIDELSATVPDQHFLENVDSTLAKAGYEVRYYGPSEVTIGLFQNLPVTGYDLVIIRAHSGETSIYTSEPYSESRYVYEQLTDQIVPAYLDGKLYFAITQNYVQNSFHGNFHGSLIITMGCSGLSDTRMAQAFLNRGAGGYVGWDRAVSPGQTDSAIAFLVESLSQGVTVKEGVGLAQAQSSGDSSFQSRLSYYDQSIAPRQQTGRSLQGLGGLFLIVLIMCTGPASVIIIPRLFSKH